MIGEVECAYMDTMNFLYFVLGTVISFGLYWLARRDSRREARELRRLSIMMMNAMESAGWVKWARDEHGDPTGRLIEVSAGIDLRWSTRAHGTPTVTPPE
jgi:hypothetical protein